MAAARIRCANCGTLFDRRQRTQFYCQKTDCQKARNAAKVRAHRLRGVPPYEEVVVAEIGAGRLSPGDGLLWVVFPAQMRARTAVQVTA